MWQWITGNRRIFWRASSTFTGLLQVTPEFQNCAMEGVCVQSSSESLILLEIQGLETHNLQNVAVDHRNRRGLSRGYRPSPSHPRVPKLLHGRRLRAKQLRIADFVRDTRVGAMRRVGWDSGSLQRARFLEYFEWPQYTFRCSSTHFQLVVNSLEGCRGPRSNTSGHRAAQNR